MVKKEKGRVKSWTNPLTSPSYGVPRDKQNACLQDLAKPHRDSFNFLLPSGGGGLQLAVRNILPVHVGLAVGKRIKLWIEDARLSPPTIDATAYPNALERKLYPRECRESAISYSGNLTVDIAWSVDGRPAETVKKIAGLVPIMVKSDLCHLSKLSPAQLIEVKEDAEEIGGYFILGGNEKVMRMLIQTRRNYPVAMTRTSWRNKNPLFTEYGVQMRCVGEDQTSCTLTLHYCKDGTVMADFIYMKEQFYIPVMFLMKALVDLTDFQIFESLLADKKSDSFYRNCVASMLRAVKTEQLNTKSDLLDYIGERFRVCLSFAPDWMLNSEVAEILFKKCICIHQKSAVDKFNILCLMVRKLFAATKGECALENLDSPMNHEVLLSGHLYLMLLKEKLESWLNNIRYTIVKKDDAQRGKFEPTPQNIKNCFSQSGSVTQAVHYLLSTGNIKSESSLGLQQASGLAVVAEKINFFRFASHLRAVHRGAFFTEMRTTSVRKLLPEAWGFLCPVHTPDGSPCGLLNHLAATAEISTPEITASIVPEKLIALGMIPPGSPIPVNYESSLPVVLDGTLIGWIDKDLAADVACELRHFKVSTEVGQFPKSLEVGLVPPSGLKGAHYPGMFLFTSPARMIRKVRNLKWNKEEYIGTFEQIYLNIACNSEEASRQPAMTHVELNEGNFISFLASLTPYSDCNQSPRNMYQCQMAKQTMGFPSHTVKYRTDNKMYILQTPQTPLIRTDKHSAYNADEFPIGTNAIVAVIAYTGYDMEDAMVINKSSVERGFGYATITKSEIIDLNDERNRIASKVFGYQAGAGTFAPSLDEDGFPSEGTVLKSGDPYYAYLDKELNMYQVKKYKGSEDAIVDSVKFLLPPDSARDSNKTRTKAVINLRIRRQPIIGDKFSSRHGQKGVCSLLYRQEDMPFTEHGLVPDIIFNPHGFPSRMTIGMMIEVLAAKSAAHRGEFQDATPFTFNEKDTAINYFGSKLVEAGFSFYGNERVYSGITGQELEADIFFGPIYYQRLRHMVSDKFQVRTTGAIDKVTKQPIKGRKRGGGVRCGEMERDGLLSHGAAFLVLDRLVECSDQTSAKVCTRCGSLLSPEFSKLPGAMEEKMMLQRSWRCRTCQLPFATPECVDEGGDKAQGGSSPIETIAIPHVFNYLVAELAAMNVRVKLEVKEKASLTLMPMAPRFVPIA